MVTKKIIHKDLSGNVAEYDFGVDAVNITEDPTHRFVSDEEKAVWNAEDISSKTVDFTEEASYEIASGESTGTLLGKLKKLISVVKGILAKTDKFTSTEAGYLSGATSKIQTQLDAKAPKGHASAGTTYGAASASYYGHAKASATTPKAAGTAAVGSETATFARGDHVHPAQTSVTGNAGTATKLATIRCIDGVGFDGASNIIRYAVCNTAASTQNKAVNIPNFTLTAGARISVRFTYGNTYAEPQLSVNSGAAKKIYYDGDVWQWLYADRIYDMVYDGSFFHVVGELSKTDLDDLSKKVTSLLTELDLIMHPKSLYTSATGIVASASQTWAYASVSGLSTWQEVRMWIEVGDGSRGYHTFNRNCNKISVSASVSTSYYGCVQVLCDFENNRVGIYVTAKNGWDFSGLRVLRVEGLVKGLGIV